MRERHRLRRGDLLWILAYPLYQLIGTFRHEASHALVAVLQGARIREFVFWPGSTGSGFSWGYVSWSGCTNWVATAAPYLCDLVVFVLFFAACTRLRFRRHWVWVNLVVVGMISPLANSAYNYATGLRGLGDVAFLLQELPSPAVHSYFVVTLLAYAGALGWALWPRTARTIVNDI
jgi:hypothetical protein